MYRFSDKDLAILNAYVLNGTCAGAAEELELREQSIKNRLYLMRLKAHVPTNVALVYELRDDIREYRKSRKAA